METTSPTDRIEQLLNKYKVHVKEHFVWYVAYLIC